MSQIQHYSLFILLLFSFQKTLTAQVFSPKYYDDYPVIENLDSLEKAVYAKQSNTVAYMHALITLALSRASEYGESNENDLNKIEEIALAQNDKLGKAMSAKLNLSKKSKKYNFKWIKDLHEAEEYFTQIKDTLGMITICAQSIYGSYEYSIDFTFNTNEFYDTQETKLINLGRATAMPAVKLRYYYYMICGPINKQNWNSLSENLALFDTAIKIINQNPKYEYWRREFYEALSWAYFNVGNSKKSLDAQLISYSLQKKNALNTNIIPHYNLGEAYMYDENYKMAEKCFKKGLLIEAKMKNEDIFLVKACYQDLFNAQCKQKKYEEAIKNIPIIDSLNLNIIEGMKKKTIAEAEIQYQTMKKETANQSLIQEKSNLQKYNFLLFLGIIFTSFTLILLFIVTQKLRKNRLELSKAYQELDEVSHFRERVFSIVAHDLRSPITTYNGLSQMCSYLIKNKRWADLAKVSMQLDSLSANLNTILDNLLQWVMKDKKVEHTPIKEFDAQTSIESVLPLYDNIGVYKNVSLRPNIEKNITLSIDENAFKLILRNLLDNAIKNADDGTSVLLTMKKEQDFIALTIANQSQNIQPNIVKNIQELFATKSNLDTEKSGLGLGLIMVKDFATANNTSLTLSQEKENWLIFEAKFPKV